MMVPAQASSSRRILNPRNPRDNGAVTASGVDRWTSGDWQWLIVRIRTWGDRLRAWDTEHQRRSDAGIAVLLFVVCMAFPPSFGVERPENIVFQAALAL